MADFRTMLRARWLTGAAALGLGAAVAMAPVQAASAAADGQAAAAPQAAADDAGNLQEIVVTAQHRSENLQKVPIAVTAVTAQAMKNNGIDTTRDLPQIIPSVQFTRSGASGLFFVRGVGTTNAAVGEEGSNAIYIDGVYLADLGQAINNFNNVERVEVLKGPQGTLFGRNAFGGLINIITLEPGDKAEFKGELGYGNYRTIHSQGYVAEPISDKISADLAWTQLYQGDGWGRNVTLNRKSKIQSYGGLRSKIVARPTDTIKVTLAGDYYRNKDNLGLAWKLIPGVIGTGGQVGPSGQDTNANTYAITRQKNYGFSATVEIDLGFARLTDIAAYRKTQNKSAFDVDGGPLNLINIAFTSGGKSIQEELRLASTSTEPFSWQLGAFYLNTRARNDSFFSGSAFGVLAGQHILAQLDTDSYAAFGEATYSITPTTKITGGIRYTKDKRNFNGSQFNVLASGATLPSATILTPSGTVLATPGVNLSKQSYDEITYRVALRQEITDRINAYASFNRGFKAGTYSLQSPLTDPVLPQFINAFEVGLKSELFDRKLRVNLAGYHYNIDNYQIRSAAAAAPGATVLLNAATVKVDGFDAEFEAAPTHDWRLFGGLTVLNSRYGKFGGSPVATTPQAPIVYPIYAGQTAATTCPAALRGTANPGLTFPGTPTGGFVTCFGDVSGLKTPLAPKFTASLGSSYMLSVGATGSLRLSALYSYNSGYVFEPDNRFKQGSFSLLNASVEYKPTDAVGIEFWAKNIADKAYAVQDLTSGTGSTVALGAPRTYGVNLKFDF